MRRLLLSAAARRDLRSIVVYTREVWGTSQAERYRRMLEDAFERLRSDEHPGCSRPDLGAGRSSLRAGRHVVVFRIDGGVVRIVRVLHVSMVPRRHLGGD
ncbi:type II toxin-antitoxin system RelE/ParE family toxin [Segnochrobactrum spirostomi]|uniref:Type II toxin-antitoxin system RelE/ParE family toxin n=1 Tax=Segnochrobactrum spirostomi TaxID=2608987 RepID=A0A6A7Y3D8_9HYPH|nr:type II toxin-antitoxin system RelE/ParE family toxin [Segnochrobactrum spirostomi]